MMSYNVRFGVYKADQNKIKWTVLTNVVADGVIAETKHRWFHLSNDVRLEVPTEGMVFEFSAERYKQIMSGEKGEKDERGK